MAAAYTFEESCIPVVFKGHYSPKAKGKLGILGLLRPNTCMSTPCAYIVILLTAQAAVRTPCSVNCIEYMISVIVRWWWKIYLQVSNQMSGPGPGPRPVHVIWYVEVYFLILQADKIHTINLHVCVFNHYLTISDNIYIYIYIYI